MGQLANRSRTNEFIFSQILDEVQSVSAGSVHTMVLKTDGTFWGSGNNNYGQLAKSPNNVTFFVQLSY